MRKTLVLVFIHGFQGDDDTFASFPKHLQALVNHALPNIDVVPLIYPKFETRGALPQAVAAFREWLQDKIIDIEVAHNTPSPTVDPSVHTVLIGHSMGGIIAAETYLLLASEQPVTASASAMNPETPNFPSNTTMNSTTGSTHPNPVAAAMPDTSATLMFPHIQAVISFDTPFLGLAPSMVASQVEGAHGVASTAYNTYNEAAKMFGWGANPAAPAPNSAKALPAPAVSPLDDAAAAPKWQSWGKVAMFAGAAGAVAAGGAAALYSQREKISAGWGWASSHLLFVGDLVKAESLKRRVEMLEKATAERNGKCANIYTNLGKGKREGSVSGGGGKRTFANLPNKVTGKGKSEFQGGMKWIEAVNDKAKDEISAHCSMFTPRDNPGFYALGEKAKVCVVDSVDRTWYESSEKKVRSDMYSQEGTTALGDGEAWEKAEPEEHKWEGVDGGSDADDVKMTESYEGLNKGSRAQEELEDSVIVDKAEKENGHVPPPESNPWTTA
ncbi:uncharacterized protein HMPREF1541_09959 [Cyphellophora europaea CBS 101466]|uniref:DUF676 domain-containing protein n=1 Tax=Cyphellophora europaea (strain CBS 101466) TaxID=1220924 RepID=W2SAN3_CYPE1|nr:uncharacterized protein HMPREF1541_09959 [Cyphellophora europaea CBS 101466]ETN45083.1 hypothetical protein HMPREF1541_09959 [Cyphellophora europaea CBS 101466]